jgi:hypothetical protein
MLEWKVRLLTVLVVGVVAVGDLISGYNWNW